MKLDPKELIEKVAVVAGFSDEEKTAFVSALKEDTVIEGEIGQTILKKSGNISSLDFLLADPTTKEETYARVMRESMPKVEGGTKKAFLTAFPDLTEAEIDSVWNDPENKKLNNKVFKANELVKKKFQGKLDQAIKAPEELQTQIKTVQAENQKLQSFVDEMPSKYEAQIKAKERGFTEQLFSYKLIHDIKSWGGDPLGMERGIAMQVAADYHTDIDENGNAVLRQKSNPESKITDPNSGVTLTYEQVIKRDFPKIFSRNNGDQGTTQKREIPQPPTSGTQYPKHIKTAKQKAQYDIVQARRKAQNGG